MKIAPWRWKSEKTIDNEMEKMFNKKFLVNETCIVDHSIHDEWLRYFKSIYIKDLLKSGLISDLIFSKIIAEYNPDGTSYALQFQADRQNLEQIQSDKTLAAIRKILDAKFKNRLASFITVLEIEQI